MADDEFTFMTDENAGNGSAEGGNGGVESPVQQPRRHRRRMSPQHIRRIKRRRRIKRILIGLLIVLLALAGIAAWFGVSAMKTKNEIQQAVSVATGLQDSLSGGDTSSLDKTIDQFSVHVDKAYGETSSVLWAVAARVPYYGNDISAVRTAVTALENISSQGLPALSDALSNMNLNSISVTNGTISIPGVDKAAESLKQADTVITNANHSLAAVPTTHIQQVTDAIDKANDYLGKLNDTVHNASVFAQLAPKMLAMDGQTRTYLILAQTNSEIRPSGGLPGSWGTMSVTNGKITMHEFVAETTVQTPDQPVVPITAEEKTLFTDKLARVPQDVNFTADFPRTGEIAKALWANTYKTQVDGVIAIDPIFLQNMLKVTGGATLEDGKVLDGTNAAQYLLNQVYIDKPVVEQDAYFAQAASAVFAHVMQQSGDAQAYMKEMLASINGGHLLMWNANAEEQKLLEDTPIAGKLVTAASDPQVGVYFTDISQAKMDWYLKREVTTEFDKVAENGANQYTVHIRLTNTLSQDQISSLPKYIVGPYIDGLQAGQIRTQAFVYAPKNGRLVDWTMSDGSQFDGISVHDGLTVGLKTFNLSPGESYEITVHVQTAPGVNAELALRQTPLIESDND
ncbi:DUF4012 domain-containing protein [Bifidobacterium amazonense]|uniref:DUF4012 domain-containing protein n=1 Tax=Bifidobacterium amazonense TaxID=2809027 RepID=A0ABS9VY15_9BIFI|nr:DUF4012 domain-containing protein [Bifidobacterium amazonense]